MLSGMNRTTDSPLNTLTCPPYVTLIFVGRSGLLSLRFLYVATYKSIIGETMGKPTLRNKCSGSALRQPPLSSLMLRPQC